MTIQEHIKKIMELGLNQADATAKLCQDIILCAISKSKLAKSVTVKGGVAMRGISRNIRRATQDLDLDFIRYSLDSDSIKKFVSTINCLDDYRIELVGSIEELKQQDYHGKRIHVKISDTSNRSLVTKVDIGVHVYADIQQDEFCFDVALQDSNVRLLINSKEQMLAEKLRAILKFGVFSTRYKDLFDIYWLKDFVSEDKVMQCLSSLIFEDSKMKENNASDVLTRLNSIFENAQFARKVDSSNENSLDIPHKKVLDGIVNFLEFLCVRD